MIFADSPQTRGLVEEIHATLRAVLAKAGPVELTSDEVAGADGLELFVETFDGRDTTRYSARRPEDPRRARIRAALLEERNADRLAGDPDAIVDRILEELDR